MENLVIYGPHAALGLAALGLFWRALATAKGSPPHKRAGRLYLLLVAPLIASVAPISFAAFAAKGPAALVQLFYLALVFAAAGWTLWRAIRDKHDAAKFRGRVFVTLAWMLVAIGAALLSIGIARDNVLTVGFSAIGIIYGGAMLGFSPTSAPADWSLEWHLNGVCLLFAATHASITRLVIRSALPQYDNEYLHAGTQLGVIAFAYLLRQWMRRRYQGERVRPARAFA